MFVQSDVLGVGFAGAVVRPAPQWGAGPRGVCRGGSDTEAVGVGERAPSGGRGGGHMKYTRTSVRARSLRATAE